MQGRTEQNNTFRLQGIQDKIIGTLKFQYANQNYNSEVLLTVHLSIILVTDQLNAPILVL